jgi:hypothetical protein
LKRFLYFFQIRIDVTIDLKNEKKIHVIKVKWSVPSFKLDRTVKPPNNANRTAWILNGPNQPTFFDLDESVSTVYEQNINIISSLKILKLKIGLRQTALAWRTRLQKL